MGRPLTCTVRIDLSDLYGNISSRSDFDGQDITDCLSHATKAHPLNLGDTSRVLPPFLEL